tara:strand:- start:6366 stop:7034 length:669 start_codon:yes stop_codon:yes gene_type:complete
MRRPIILVGSSGKILDSKHGETIDKFAHVVRFNAYQIEGYEEFVGTKEKIWAPNLGITQHTETTRKYLASNDYVWYVGSNYNLEKQLLITKKKLNKQFVIESINAGVSNFIDEVKDNFKGTGLCYERGKIRTGDEGKYATTGLRGIFKAIERFGMVYVHGFSFYQECEGDLKNSHYYEVDNVPEHMRKAFTEHPQKEHDVEAENRIFKQLISLGWVRTLEKI